MKKLFAALVASVCLAFPAFAQTRLPGPSSISPETAEMLFLTEMDAWRTACREMKVLCSAWAPPVVTYGLLKGPFGRYELGSHTIQLDIRILGQSFSYVVMVHEMVHYLQYTVFGPILSSCEAEEQAFRIGMKVALDLNIQDPRIKTWTEMKHLYGCGPLPPRRDTWRSGTRF